MVQITPPTPHPPLPPHTCIKVYGPSVAKAARVLCFCGSQTMQYVMLTYMKHLGVKVKEPRGLEQKRARINFLPKIKVRTLELL